MLSAHRTRVHALPGCMSLTKAGRRGQVRLMPLGAAALRITSWHARRR